MVGSHKQTFEAATYFNRPTPDFFLIMATALRAPSTIVVPQLVADREARSANETEGAPAHKSANTALM
jgi:hypothetical protein